jgi:hypothetical protein
MKKSRENPASFLPPAEMKRIAGQLVLDAVLAGCSFEEQILLGAIIPELLRIIRSSGLTDPSTFPAVNIDITGSGPVISIQRPETSVRGETTETPRETK